MKFFEPTNKRTTIAVYVFLVALFSVFCVIVGINISVIPRAVSFVFSVLKPLIYGIIIAFMLDPLVCTIEFKFLVKWKNKPSLKHILSVVIAYVLVLSFIAVFAVVVIPQLVADYDKFEVQFEVVASNVKNNIAEIVSMLPGRESLYAYYNIPAGMRVQPTDDVFAISLRNTEMIPISSRANETQQEIQEALTHAVEAANNFLRVSLPGIYDALKTLIEETKNVVMGLMVSVYFLLSSNYLLKNFGIFAKVWLPKRIYKNTSLVYDKVKNIFRDYIIVRLLDSIIMGILSFFALLIFRAPYPFFLSVIMALASLIPFIGAAIGIALGTVVMLIVAPQYAMFYLIVMLVIQIVDSRYIEKLLARGHPQHKLPAVWIFAGVIVMGGAFGIIGFLIGIPLSAFIYSLVKDFGERRLKHKSLPYQTYKWMEIDRKKQELKINAEKTE